MDTLPETSLFRYLDYTLGCIWYGVLRIWDGILDVYGMVYLGLWWYGPIGLHLEWCTWYSILDIWDGVFGVMVVWSHWTI